MILAHYITTVKTLFVLINIGCSRRLSTTRFSWASTLMRAQKNSCLYRLFGFRVSPPLDMFINLSILSVDKQAGQALTTRFMGIMSLVFMFINSQLNTHEQVAL